MPQIPAYDGPQVGLRQLNLDQASADSFGGVQGRQITQIGQGAMQIGNALDAINEREISTQVFNAEASAKEAFTKWQQEATRTRQGEVAKGLAKDAEGWWGKAAQEYSKDLSPMAQRMLQKAFTQQGVASLGQMATYENAQLEGALQTAKQKNLNASYDRAVADPSPANIDVQRAGVIASLIRAGDNTRLSPEAWRQHADEAVANMHARVFSSLAASNPAAASAYFKTYDKEFIGEQRTAVLNQLKSVVATEEGRTGARDEIATATKDLGETDPFPRKQLDAAGVERFKGNEAALEQYRHEVDRAALLWSERGNQIIGNAGEQATAAIAKGMSWEQFKATGATKGISEGEQAKIQLAYKAQQIQLYSQDIHRRELSMREQELRAAPKMWEYASDPAKLAALTEQQVRSLYTEVGFANASKLAAERQQYINNQAKLEEAKLDSDMFKDLATRANFDVNVKRGTEADELTRLRNETEREIRARQHKLGRPLYDEEKRDAMQSVIDNKVIMGWYRDDRPVSVLTEDQLKSAKVRVYENQTSIYGGSRVEHTLPIASIPRTFRADTIATFNKKGIPVTEQLIGQAWFDAAPAKKQEFLKRDEDLIKQPKK